MKHKQKDFYSLSEVAEMLDINAWTIHLWSNRFDIFKPRSGNNGEILFTSADVERMKSICSLVKKKGMTPREVRKHLESLDKLKS